MTARTHDAVAFASLLTVTAYYPPATLNLMTAISAIVGNIVGALIPDMDQAGNRLWDLLPAGDYLGKIFSGIFYKHRSITHSLLGIFLIYKILEFALPKLLNSNFVDPQLLLASIMIGYISHLVADAFTEEGLPLFFPFRWSFGFPPIAPWRVTTDSWFETYVIQPAILVYIVWFIAIHQYQLLGVIKLIVK